MGIVTQSLSQSTGLQSDDELLLTRIRDLECQASFAKLFDQYYDWLGRLAYGWVGCPHQAEEIVLDVFTKLWRGRADINVRSRVKAYLFIAVRNQSLDYLRKQRRRRPFVSEMPLQAESNYDDPEQTLIGAEFAQSIEAAIEQLPPRGKMIFRMSRDGNLKYREIAEQLGISVKTVETHMRRAFIHLRQELSHWMPA